MSPRRRTRSRPKWQRIAAYAVVVRDGRILLSQIAPRVSPDGKWTLPGGGIEHGENPRASVVREVYEETGLEVSIGDTSRVYSLHAPRSNRQGRRVDAHSLRIVFEGWVAPDAPEPRVIEVNGSTVAAAWHRISDVRSGRVPTVDLVRQALAEHQPHRMQRVNARAVIRRESGASGASGDSGGEVLLARIGERGVHTGSWLLPGGGIDHGETPQAALVREVWEECGLRVEVGELLGVHNVHFAGVAPSGRFEDYHAVELVFAASLADPAAEPRVVETDGTTDLASWVPVADVEQGRVDVLDVVRVGLGLP